MILRLILSVAGVLATACNPENTDGDGSGGGSATDATSVGSEGATSTTSPMSTTSTSEATTTAGDDSGGTTMAQTDGSDTSATTTAGPTACGETQCDATDVCVLPCCGGAGDVCTDVPREGCADGYEEVDPDECALGICATATCCFGPCVPAPPYCVPLQDQDQHCEADADPSDGICEQVCA